MKISGKKILILATNGFEQSELEVPRDRLKAAGATVHVVSPEKGEIKGWDMKDWGHPVKVDRTLDEVSADEYDAIVLPGGQINPDLLRINEKALALIKAFYQQKKVVAAVCHAPCINAGAKWEDSQVVTDTGIITSRNPGDLEAFSNKIIEEVAEGLHQRRSAA
jgi:protease I